MKTYNEKTLEVAKKIANLSSENRRKYSKATAVISVAGILIGTMSVFNKSGKISYGLIGLGVVSLFTSIKNIKK